jgi:hypothetical protein
MASGLSTRPGARARNSAVAALRRSGGATPARAPACYAGHHVGDTIRCKHREFVRALAIVALTACGEQAASRAPVRPPVAPATAPLEPRSISSARVEAAAPKDPCRGLDLVFEDVIRECRCRRSELDRAKVPKCDESGPHDDQPLEHLRPSLEAEGAARPGGTVRLWVRWTNVTDAPVRLLLDRKATMTVSLFDAKGRPVRRPDCPPPEGLMGELRSIDPAVVTLEPQGELRVSIEWSATVPPGSHCGASEAPPLVAGRYRVDVWGEPIWSHPRDLGPSARGEIQVE